MGNGESEKRDSGQARISLNLSLPAEVCKIVNATECQNHAGQVALGISIDE
jgi:hypothetical protein